MLHTTMNETFPRYSPNAIGVGANGGNGSIAPTPMALGLNVSVETVSSVPLAQR